MAEIRIPDLDWYTGLSHSRKVQPRCPFASVETCPRYFQSLALLGSAGSTSIDDAEEDRLITYWKVSDLWPKTNEYETSVAGPKDSPKIFANFCPEIAFDRFGYFASFLARYSDEIDSDSAHASLTKQEAPAKDWRWYWNSLTQLHYLECHYYSLLDHRSQNNRFPFVNFSKDESQGPGSPSEKMKDSSKNNGASKKWWKRLSSKAKVVIVSITTITALLATFLTNIEKIDNFFDNKEPPVSVSNIVVKLTNSSDVSVIVSARGDFRLWLPGPGTRHTMGKYEFLLVNGKSPEGGRLVVAPRGTVTVYAKIMNQAYFAKILFQSDCDLSLIVYRAKASFVYTNEMPFTVKAIEKYYLQADVGK